MIRNTTKPSGRIPQLLGSASLADLYLAHDAEIKVCARDGATLVHKVLLASVSPLLRHCLNDIGRTEEEVSTVIAPDFTHSELEKFVKLLYGIETDVESEQELDSVIGEWECFLQCKVSKKARSRSPKSDSAVTERNYFEPVTSIKVEAAQFIEDEGFEFGAVGNDFDDDDDDPNFELYDHEEGNEDSYDYHELDLDMQLDENDLECDDEEQLYELTLEQLKELRPTHNRADNLYYCSYPGCDYACADRGKVHRHIRETRQHDSILCRLSADKDLNTTPVHNEEEKTFACPFTGCSFKNEDRAKVVRHIRETRQHDSLYGRAALKRRQKRIQEAKNKGIKLTTHEKAGKARNVNRILHGVIGHYKCAHPACDYRTDLRTKLRRHMSETKAHPREYDMTEESRTIFKTGGRIVFEDGWYRCNIPNCDYGSEDIDETEQHIVATPNHLSAVREMMISRSDDPNDPRVKLGEHGRFYCTYPGCTFMAISKDRVLIHYQRTKKHRPLDDDEGLHSQIAKWRYAELPRKAQEKKEREKQNNWLFERSLAAVENHEPTKEEEDAEVAKIMAIEAREAAKEEAEDGPIRFTEKQLRSMKPRLGEDGLFYCSFPGCLYFSEKYQNAYRHMRSTKDHDSINARKLMQKRAESPPIPPGDDNMDRDGGHFRCAYPTCEYSTNIRRKLKRHMNETRGHPRYYHQTDESITIFESKGKALLITNENMYKCNFPGCDFKSDNCDTTCKHYMSSEAHKRTKRRFALEDEVKKSPIEKVLIAENGLFRCFLPDCEFSAETAVEVKVHLEKEDPTHRAERDRFPDDPIAYEFFLKGEFVKYAFKLYTEEERIADIEAQEKAKKRQEAKEEPEDEESDDEDNEDEEDEAPLRKKKRYSQKKELKPKVSAAPSKPPKPNPKAAPAGEVKVEDSPSAMICHLCGASIFGGQMKRHMATMHSAISCKQCDQKFDDKASFQIHMEDEHEDGSKIVRRYRRPGFVNINFTPHPEDPLRCPEPNCKYRHKTNPRRVRGHYMSSHVFQFCPYCNKKLLWSSMEKHIAVMHEQDKCKFSCEDCDKKFFDLSSFRSHREKWHIKDPKYICQQCGEAFVSISGYYAHKSRIHNKQGERYKCPVCTDKTYKNERKFKEHVKKFHPEEYHNYTKKREGMVLDFNSDPGQSYKYQSVVG